MTQFLFPRRARHVAPTFFVLALAFSAPSPNTVFAASTDVVKPLQTLKIARPFSWNIKTQGAFVTCLARDNRGRVWTGTEDFGVWMQGENGTWRNFNSRNSALADDSVYALAVDKKGRVWAGTTRNGVSVFDGVEKWRNFNLSNGPLGERVFKIAVNPLDGDVWMATNAGLSRYSVSKTKWTHFTRNEGLPDGLPSDQIQSLAFDAKGTLFAATQCDGLAIASPISEYSKWRRVVAPSGLNFDATGKGLPSNLLNDVLVARDGTITVASNFGVAFSKDSGATWNFVRGADYESKVRERFGGAPKDWKAQSGAILSEDYTTCLAQSDSQIWLGHRRRAYEVFDEKLGNRVLDGSDTKVDAALAEPGDYVTAILPMSNEAPLLARYGGGLTQAPTVSISAKSNVVPVAALPTKAAPFPAYDAIPTVVQLRAMTKNVAQKPAALAIGDAVFQGEDWRTMGDWVGRYGRGSTVLCSTGSPFDHLFNRGVQYDQIIGQLGYNRTSDDRLRHYLSDAQKRRCARFV